MARPLTTSDVLADFTTFHVGGRAARLIVALDEAELIDVLRQIGPGRDDLLVVSGGSNMLVSDDGFPGTAVVIATTGITAEADGDRVRLTVAAGETWDDLVAHTLDRGWSGLEMLSGIPGLAGAAPIQNIGAYGAEAASVITEVRAFDRDTDRIVVIPAQQCGFGYRNSMFKQAAGRYVVLGIGLALRVSGLSGPIEYKELATSLGLGLGDRAPLADVRQAVLALRRGKGMVLDETDHDTWSAGSFFTNPLLSPGTAAGLPTAAPRFPQPDGSVKTSAAWLIEQTGFHKGYGLGPARLSGKHVLALTNQGGATARDILHLAHQIRDRVRTVYGVTLTPEPQLVGLNW